MCHSLLSDSIATISYQKLSVDTLGLQQSFANPSRFRSARMRESHRACFDIIQLLSTDSSPTQISPGQVDPAQDGPGQISPAQVSSSQDGLAQVGPA